MNAENTSPTDEDIESEEMKDQEPESGENESPEEKGENGPDREDPLESLKKKLSEKQEELAGEKDKLIRLKAETDNFRKRLSREKDGFAQFANERLLKDVLPIYENLERALSTPNITVESLQEGVEMILKQFSSFLDKEKVKPVESVGQKFDPSIHEAMSQMESDDHEDDTVIQEYSKGYYLNGRILQPARVVICKNSSGGKKKKNKEKDSKSKSESKASKKNSSKSKGKQAKS